MEASSPVISENLSTEGNPTDRSICFQTISSDENLLFMEAGSIEPNSRCLPIKLVPQKSMLFPSFFMIPRVWSNVLKEKVSMMILVTPAWPSQLWYPEAMRMSIQKPILLTWRRDVLKNPKGEIHPLVQNKTLKFSGMGGLNARLQKEGVSREASNLIIKYRRSSSNSNYELTWGKWNS